MHRCSKYYGDLVVRGQISQTCFPELLKLTLYFDPGYKQVKSPLALNLYAQISGLPACSRTSEFLNALKSGGAWSDKSNVLSRIVEVDPLLRR
jgi:hypothetical protein